MNIDYVDYKHAFLMAGLLIGLSSSSAAHAQTEQVNHEITIGVTTDSVEPESNHASQYQHAHHDDSSSMDLSYADEDNHQKHINLEDDEHAHVSASESEPHSPHEESLHNDDSQYNDKNAEEDEHQQGITLSPEKIALADIQIRAIQPEIQFSTVYAPAEVLVNGYSSYVVSPRTESVIISRHAALGEHVKKGQKLVTLFSEEMVQAQADYLIASTEWQRVKTLGNRIVSDSDSVQAKTAFKAAFGKLIAYGVTQAEINNISNNDVTSFGEYTLIAQRDGVVLQDDFIQGQRVDAGEAVMLLANEQQLWVEAKISPYKQLELTANAPAIVELDGQTYQASVIQESHTIDPVTRTRIIRLLVNNSDDSLHPGMFVKVHFQFATATKVIAVPEQALIRSPDGDWMVFVEDHPGEFQAVEVELGRALGSNREILGLANNTRVVTKGAFFVASEIAKGGFDPHNH
ncbi:efflux RND transporter periplasmic adaptor subunit [Shewanella gaetbuli]|uniref:Efflux RND transporter periplasmic adaptor subunit n=1 Tax=Shewanella gaetbuli TaxID=220752 RepID=A0A9X1ZM32_9GAMM|nr:efflux RND transporter periplasmic adaptor subunit [Shewanella gaetbuli]MCL1143472.1 efflux RND transporter periplasmic adaptor subunit [Shewanella gaetbuli]